MGKRECFGWGYVGPALGFPVRTPDFTGLTGNQVSLFWCQDEGNIFRGDCLKCHFCHPPALCQACMPPCLTADLEVNYADCPLYEGIRHHSPLNSCRSPCNCSRPVSQGDGALQGVGKNLASVSSVRPRAGPWWGHL